MRALTYSVAASADGYIAGPDGVLSARRFDTGVVVESYRRTE